jgi:hypothetical protein
MNDHEKSQLLEKLFADDELEHLRRASLSRGSKEMRRRRQRSMAARVFVMSLPVLLLATLVFHPHWRASIQPPARSAPPQTTDVGSKVECITAEQLFALFPNREMALIGKPGHQQLIFLDDSPAVDRQ